MTHIVYTHFVKEVPKDHQTAAYRLFHRHRRIMVQQLFTMNAGTLAEVGAPTSGNANVDKDLRSEWVTIELTAPEMCTYLHKGASIMFPDYKAATALYLDLVEHLKQWIVFLDRNPSYKSVPLDDLRQFDELAAAVFPYASTQLIAHEDDIGYGAFLARTARRRRGLRAELTQQHEERSMIRPVYRSFSEQIAERLARRLG